jgi:hypothetical protein
MKKQILIGAAFALALLVSTALSAQTKTSSQPDDKTVKTTQQVSNPPCTFVDKNNDGICDYHQSKVSGQKGRYFVDKNGDGICDNCQVKKGNTNCPGYGKPCQGNMGKGNCGGCGMGPQHRNHGANCPNRTQQQTDPSKK